MLALMSAIVTSYGGDANYIENGEFSFEIVMADIDVSGLKWQYSHGDVTAGIAARVALAQVARSRYAYACD